MALSQIEAARIQKLVGAYIEGRRPPPHIRPKLDLGFRVKGQSIEIFEVRPVWRGKLGEKHEGSVAKATYVRTNNRWRVFWMRADLKWHRYEPASEVQTVEDFLAVVDKDAYACFWG
jgi:spore coat polysaccharide biosynthesis protein SpsF (cytidylyltransferase family)